MAIIKGIILLWIIFGWSWVEGQELNCMVQVQAPNVQGIDRTIFRQMENDITRYLNQNKWTDDEFAPQERIKCQITITLNKVPSVDRFEGSMQVQVIRPVYNATFESVILNYQDKDFQVNYVPFQTMQFSPTTYVSNLTSILNYWAYMILGVDYDSFGKGDGIPYFQKAQQMLNLAQEGGEKGWNAMDGTNNRYWLVENFLNSSYNAIHDVYYTYHRKGLDQMYQDVQKGRDAVLETLNQLRTLFLQNPNIILAKVFTTSKVQELTQMFMQATPQQKQQLLEIMRVLDPGNMRFYEQIQTSP